MPSIKSSAIRRCFLGAVGFVALAASADPSHVVRAQGAVPEQRRIIIYVWDGFRPDSVNQIRFVLRLFRERLVESRLIRPRIDLDENVAFLDHLALLERDLGDLAVDPAVHRDGVVWLHGAEPVGGRGNPLFAPTRR
jgi:hypothetical protein